MRHVRHLLSGVDIYMEESNSMKMFCSNQWTPVISKCVRRVIPRDQGHEAMRRFREHVIERETCWDFNGATRSDASSTAASPRPAPPESYSFCCTNSTEPPLNFPTAASVQRTTQCRTTRMRWTWMPLRRPPTTSFSLQKRSKESAAPPTSQSKQKTIYHGKLPDESEVHHH